MLPLERLEDVEFKHGDELRVCFEEKPELPAGCLTPELAAYGCYLFACV